MSTKYPFSYGTPEAEVLGKLSPEDRVAILQTHPLYDEAVTENKRRVNETLELNQLIDKMPWKYPFLSYTAKDTTGNISTIRHTFTVNELPDTIAPVLSSTNKTFTTTVGKVLPLEIVTATDNNDLVLTVTQTGSVDFTKVGPYTITYTAIDKAGNKSTIIHTYIVNQAS